MPVSLNSRGFCGKKRFLSGKVGQSSFWENAHISLFEIFLFFFFPPCFQRAPVRLRGALPPLPEKAPDLKRRRGVKAPLPPGCEKSLQTLPDPERLTPEKASVAGADPGREGERRPRRQRGRRPPRLFPVRAASCACSSLGHGSVQPFSCTRGSLPGREKRSIMTVKGTAQGAHQTGNKERS